MDAQDDDHRVSFEDAGLSGFHVQTLMRKEYGGDQPATVEEGLTRAKAQEAIEKLLRPKQELWMPLALPVQPV